MSAETEHQGRKESISAPWLRRFGIDPTEGRKVVVATLNALVSQSSGKLRGQTDRQDAYRQAERWITNFIRKRAKIPRHKSPSPLSIAVTAMVHEVFELAEYAGVKWKSGVAPPPRVKKHPKLRRKKANKTVSTTKVTAAPPKAPNKRAKPDVESTQRPAQARSKRRGKSTKRVPTDTLGGYGRGADNTGEIAQPRSPKPHAKGLNDLLDRFYK